MINSSTSDLLSAQTMKVLEDGAVGSTRSYGLTRSIDLRPRNHARALDVGEDAGFTLIELMVVLLILAILLAIAIPTFLGVTKSANDRASQSNLNTALVNAKATYQSNGQTYGTGTTGAANAATFVPLLQSAEGSIGFLQGAVGTSAATTTAGAAATAGSSGSQSVISVSVSADGNGVVLANWSKSGNCWYVVDNAQAISTTNTASTTAPYGASGTATATNGTAGGLSLVLPTAAGTTYAEVKGDTVPSDCNAASPKATGTGSLYQFQTSGFPS
jgi:type IV pilus assembly protein PilA